jgi:hypothetical protein
VDFGGPLTAEAASSAAPKAPKTGAPLGRRPLSACLPHRAPAPAALGSAAQEVWDRRCGVAKTLQLGMPLDQIQAVDNIRGWLKERLDEGEWRDRWLDLMAWSAGCCVNQPDAMRRLVGWLSSRKQRVVFLSDGIDDVFQELGSCETQQRALRALLQDVPNWLRQDPERWVGAVIFVGRYTSRTLCGRTRVNSWPGMTLTLYVG